MNVTATLQKDGNKASEHVARYVVDHADSLEELLQGMSSDVKRVKNAAAKAIRFVSEEAPELLIPHFATIRKFMSSPDTICKWIAVDVIGNLARADHDGLVDHSVMKVLTEQVEDDALITAGHAIDALGKIASAKPRRRTRITAALMQVETLERNAECRNILLGKTVEAFRRYHRVASPSTRGHMEDVAKRLLTNDRPSTRRRAESFIKQRAHA
ncbi:MAG: hypothetical protein QGI68_13690 [Pseudomonadales bacterium]|jgi:hypothetical protein|nr:hypothetical protein [Pseudomonadales bacterium]MDP7357367.1 hypothetical protein [Pseudomonadales bacterium]MDP7596600.1 hypothetical protein [Pseudomonadales bacterium]HJN53398.1 hypothetical protein [Pseudomonadales bacterium]|tara:strand:- start:1139 stop:1780 length:642 start_codon:yes stop_codon:yes gene_type:complete